MATTNHRVRSPLEGRYAPRVSIPRHTSRTCRESEVGEDIRHGGVAGKAGPGRPGFKQYSHAD